MLQVIGILKFTGCNCTLSSMLPHSLRAQCTRSDSYSYETSRHDFEVTGADGMSHINEDYIMLVFLHFKTRKSSFLRFFRRFVLKTANGRACNYYLLEQFVPHLRPDRVCVHDHRKYSRYPGLIGCFRLCSGIFPTFVGFCFGSWHFNFLFCSTGAMEYMHVCRSRQFI